MSVKTSPASEPAIIVIFGITGDLSKRYLLPALYHLLKNNLLDEHAVILGVTRRDIKTKDLIDEVELSIKDIDGGCDEAIVSKLRSKLQMLQLDITKGSEYKKLLGVLNGIEDREGLCMNRLYYLSIPPQVTGSIVTHLGEYGLNESCQHGVAATRLLIEKPFGYDLYSAKELIRVISKQFVEEQIFRIDHYLAKETVQNIVTFRFNNAFEKIWDSQNISHILISAVETIDIEGRAIFYDSVGALRDIIQSHLLQLLALTALDLPNQLGSDSLHKAKLSLLNSIRPVPANRLDSLTIRGQYAGYKDDVKNPKSTTETFAAIKIEIDTERWKGVPIFLRTGKSLAKKLTEIRVVFKPSHPNSPANILIFRLQPNEGIELDLRVKRPGFEQDMQTAAMDFSYQDSFEGNGSPDAYERVLVDAVRGDHTLFSTSEEVIAAWRVVEEVLLHWSNSSDNLHTYESGTWGPAEADKLVNSAGIDWAGIAIDKKL